MSNIIKEEKSEETQKVASFHNEGAYHGASEFRNVPIPLEEVAESLPTSLINDKLPFKEFEGVFPALCKIVNKYHPEPTQEEIKNDGVTFAWATFEVALREAGPLTKSVLLQMEPLLEGKKKFIYIDSKIQFFREGDIPVDSKLWHVDGSISVRDSRATRKGFALLHDMKARLNCSVPPPSYMAYQSSTHCATQFVSQPMKIVMPACLPSFDLFDELVTRQSPEYIAQPAASIIKFDGLSIHRAVPATGDGWRLWIRCTETDRETKVSQSVISSYGTVYRP